MRTTTNLLVALGLSLVVAAACSDDESADDDGKGDRGGSSGTGGEPTGGASGDGGAPGTGGSASGGRAGTSGKGGTSSGKGGTSSGKGGTSSGEGGAGGGGNPNAGAGGGPEGGDGPGGDEPTPREICEELICPPDHLGVDLNAFCPPQPRDGGTGGTSSNEGGAAGAGGYDRELCIEYYLMDYEVAVPPQCGDEAYLYWKCMTIPSNWVCNPTGGVRQNLCGPLRTMSLACVNTYSRSAQSELSR